MRGLSWDLYLTLFVVELLVLGAQAALFKDSIAQYFRTFASKVLLATAFGFAISNANVLAPQVVRVFSTIAGSVSSCAATGDRRCAPESSESAAANACDVRFRYLCPPPAGRNLDLETQMLSWGTTYVAAIEASLLADNTESESTGVTVGTFPVPPAPGNGAPGTADAMLYGHDLFRLVCLAFAMVCYLAAITVWFTYELLTIETYVVLAIGVITMAFGANGITKPFAQGFPKFVINLGARFFTYYFVCAAFSAVLNAFEHPLTIGGLVLSAVTPMGIGSATLVAATGTVPLLAVICAACVYALPGLTGAMLRGGAALDAGAAWSQFSSAFARAAGTTPIRHKLHDGNLS